MAETGNTIKNGSYGKDEIGRLIKNDAYKHAPALSGHDLDVKASEVRRYERAQSQRAPDWSKVIKE